MQTNQVKQNLMFKQIKLSEAELNKAKSLYKDFLLKPLLKNNTLKMFDVFEPHLNNEVILKQSSSSKARKHFSTSLYYKFFEILNTTKLKNFTFENFFENLNNFCDKYTLKEDFNNKTFSNEFNVTTVKNTVNYICKILDIDHQTYLKLAHKNPIFQNMTINYFIKNIEEIRNYFGFKDNEFYEILKKFPNIATQLSSSIIDESNEIMKTLNFENINDYKEFVTTHAEVLTLTDSKLKKKIQDLSEFLELDENKVTHMVKAQAQLLITPFNYIKDNFYSMQDFLGVDKNKMSEIAFIASETIRKDFNFSKKDYETIAEMLGITVDIFIKWANITPAIYRTTPKKIEDVISYLSDILNFSREETIKYISKNLNLLSYKYTNLFDRPNENFEILNKEYGINHDNFLDILRKNSWLFGNNKELTKKNLENVQKYFNIEKNTLINMITENPLIITIHPEHIDKYIIENSQLLKISTEEYKQICIKYPSLATNPLKYQQEKITYNSEFLGISEEDMIEICRKNPKLLIEKLENINQN